MNINLTLFGQLITFVVFVWFTMKYVWNPIVAALETRKKGIADSLAQAERGKHEQELAKQRASEILHKAKADASEIVGNAQKRAAGIVEEAKGDARDEGARILSAARAEVDREVSRAREQLREQVAVLAVAGAEKILKREVDAAAHKGVVDEIAKQL
jgi:F-type H+-transporting ATPase subunit b